MWTTPKELKSQVTRLWERGVLLHDRVSGISRFPLRLACKLPASTDITNHFEQVRAWTTDLSNTQPLRVEWKDVQHRVQGLQRLPIGVWIDTMQDALKWIGKANDWERFSGIVELTEGTCPALLPWLGKRPLQALALAENWQRLLALVEWLQRHPRPGIFLRQVDVPGVPTKFIEAHRNILAELCDLALPSGCVDLSKTGTSQFTARYGFLDKPIRIRFRLLDPRIRTLAGTTCPDITLDNDNFSKLSLDVQRVIITENEINFLALPELRGSMAIFGAGYGWNALAKAQWLTRCEIYYWGDIDTHGFAILNQLRGHFGHVKSLMMDRATLEAHAALWGKEDKPQSAELSLLTSEERDLYDDLRFNYLREGLRLEQEHIGFDWVRGRLDQLG